MDEQLQEGPLPAPLDAAGDAELRALITQARRLLAERETARRKDALARIRTIAKEHGLALEVRKSPGRRGRPPKAGGPA